MKKTLKCARCGKEFDERVVGSKEIISCDHCHLQMKIDEKSQKRFRMVRYFFVLLVCIIIAFGMSMATTSSYIILLGVMSIALLIANFSDSWCLKLTNLIFGLTYEEYHPVKISNKDRLKQEYKKKKGLFR